MKSALRGIATVLLIAGTMPDVHAQATPGSSLSRGMRLVYASGGQEQAPWSVDSLDLNAKFGARERCSVVRFGANDLRRMCIDHDTLFSWNEAERALVPIRPLGAGMTMRVRASNGRTLAYETSTIDSTTISDMKVRFVRTTVSTIDSTGRVIRRLRERYAPALGTALDGVFEVPDAAVNGAWKIEREFVLARIVPAVR